jgi:hypothetical protein
LRAGFGRVAQSKTKAQSEQCDAAKKMGPKAPSTLDFRSSRAQHRIPTRSTPKSSSWRTSKRAGWLLIAAT